MSTQLLNDVRVGTMNPEQHQLVNSVSEDADRLLKITSELLNMSQVETGRMQLNIIPVACDRIAIQAVEAVQFTLQQKQLTLRQDFAADLPLVSADLEKTSWVLINFLTNAVRYAPQYSEVILKVERSGEAVQFSVEDHGRGIEERYISRIFDRYFQIPGRTADSGTGLGLSIAKDFIEAQGGTVWVKSTPGIGSVFGFQIPVAEA